MGRAGGARRGIIITVRMCSDCSRRKMRDRSWRKDRFGVGLKVLRWRGCLLCIFLTVQRCTRFNISVLSCGGGGGEKRGQPCGN
jgi:hypothetical protein